MGTFTKMIEQYEEEITGHRNWLRLFDSAHATKWERLLKADPEAAICEAATQKLLSENQVKVEPHDELSSGGPDFLCSKNERSFYVEVTCVSIEAATKDSGLNPFHSPDVDDYAYEDMTDKFRYEVCNKTPQCNKVKAPCVVVVATLHSQASDCCFDELAAEELLTGTTYITRKINTNTSEPIGNTYEITRLENSAFIRPSKDSPKWIEHARNPVSAVLLCGFGSFSPNIVGCLHSNPNYPFDRILLPQIKFCRLAEGYQAGRFEVEWI